MTKSKTMKLLIPGDSTSGNPVIPENTNKSYASRNPCPPG